MREGVDVGVGVSLGGLALSNVWAACCLSVHTLKS